MITTIMGLKALVAIAGAVDKKLASPLLAKEKLIHSTRSQDTLGILVELTEGEAENLLETSPMFKTGYERAVARMEMEEARKRSGGK